MKVKTLRFLSCTLLLILASLSLAACSQPPEDRGPNVLIILADDLGYGGVSVQGLEGVATPNIDSIAKHGVRFSSGYVSSSMCSPSRAGLLTGRYPTRFGHEFNYNPESQTQAGLPVDQLTFADRMQAAGYVTGAIGKWHVGVIENEMFHPLNRGFMESVHFPGQRKVAPLTVIRGREREALDEFIGEAMSREAGEFISRHKEKPWFLYLAPNLVHIPFEVPDELLSRVPESAGDIEHRRYLASIVGLDDMVGGVLARLRELDLEQRTLIVFLSDNGGTSSAANAPLKGGKSTTCEGGIREPLFVQWKGVIPAGRVLDQPVISLDLLPTALAAAGVAVRPAWEIDGANLLPLLKGETDLAPHPEGLFWRDGAQWAVRIGDWKLMQAETKQAETKKLWPVSLYNLADDPGERHNVLGSHPDKARVLRESWESWNALNVSPQWVLTK